MRAWTIRTTCLLLLAIPATAVLAAEPPRIGSPAPGFRVSDEEGRVHELESYRGRTVVLEWTNPGCPYVARHYRADTMEELPRRYEGEVVWLAVDSTRSNEPEDTRRWRQEQGFEYPTLQDADGELGRLYGATTTPNMYVIDSEGVLRYAGAIDDDPRGREESPRNYVDLALQALRAGENPDPSKTRPYGCSVKYR